MGRGKEEGSNLGGAQDGARDRRGAEASREGGAEQLSELGHREKEGGS